MIEFIAADDLLPLRNEVLRNGKLKNEECRFPTDGLNDAFHLGFKINGELVAAASFHPQGCAALAGEGYQLRGMATKADFRGLGIGTRIIDFAKVLLAGKQVSYLWCNARKKAVPFYINSGFEIISAEFEVQGIGPHYVMLVDIL